MRLVLKTLEFWYEEHLFTIDLANQLHDTDRYALIEEHIRRQVERQLGERGMWSEGRELATTSRILHLVSRWYGREAK